MVALAEILDLLNELERRIIRARFGLDDGTASTLQEVAVMLGIDRSLVRAIEAGALRKLASDPRLAALKDSF
jgi:RNA polymerase primary sigma factor